MSSHEGKPKVAPAAIHVETAKTVQGRAATTISVEVEEAKLGQDGADANNAQRAVAVLSHTQDGRKEWTEEELRHSGSRVTEDARVLKTFNATVQGSSEASDSGISVKVETPAGAVWSSDKNAPQPTREADKALPTKR